METFYLVDFENVNNEGIKNINLLSDEDHVHIFSTEKALNIRMDLILSKTIDIQGHIVPVRNQSLDMHLVSYLGYLLGVHGKKCSCVIISKDTDYDNIIKFWKEKGYKNIVRNSKVQGNSVQQKKESNQGSATSQNVNNIINTGMTHDLSANERCELNEFVQHELRAKGYSHNDANRVCKYVIAHCNEERMLNGIHNDLRRDYDGYMEVYEDVKKILSKFAMSKNKNTKEAKIRSFFGQHFKEKIYVNQKEAIISLILKAKTKQQINNELLKIYSDGKVVKSIYHTLQPLIDDLPGK